MIRTKSRQAYLKYLFFLCLAVTVLIPPPLVAQLEGWIIRIDKDQNRYYVTSTGKIVTEERPDFEYKAVSVEGADYYLAQGEILLRRFYPKEGLQLLKSLRMLGDFDRAAYAYSSKASALISDFHKKQGDRFDEYDREASILLCRIGEQTVLHNDYFGYTITLKGRVEIVKATIVHKELYGRGGVLAGVKHSDKEGYDYLVLINAEQFRETKIESVALFRQMLVVREGEDIYNSQSLRKMKRDRSDMELLRIRQKLKDQDLGGKRLLAVQNGTGVSMIILSPQSENFEGEIDAIIESFALSAKK